MSKIMCFQNRLVKDCGHPPFPCNSLYLRWRFLISLKDPCYPDPVDQKYLRFVKCDLGRGWYKTGGSLPSMEELSEAARPTHRYSPPTIQSMQRTHCFDTHFVLTPIVNPSFNHHHHSTNRGLQLHVFIIQPIHNHPPSIQSMKFSAE